MPYIFLACLSSRYFFLFVVLSALLSPSLGFPFPLCVFSVSLPPPSRCHSPFSPPPFPPLPPSFPRFPSPFLRSFPLLRFPLRKKFSLKSRVISSVKYMFYKICRSFRLKKVAIIFGVYGKRLYLCTRFREARPCEAVRSGSVK